MPAAEIPYEVFGLALETTRGTAVTPPTHYLPFNGMITPVREKYRPDESRGTLAEYYRSKTVHTSAKISGDGGLDPNYAPLIYNMVMKPVTSPTTPTNGVLTRLWSFVPTMNADDLKSGTFYSGDPNVQIFQAAYGMADNLKVDSDATGTDGVTWSLDATAQFPTRVSAPTFPAQNIGNLLVPGAMQLWIDTTTIGTTEITGRFVSTSWSVPTGVTYKYYANGPTGSKNFTKTGRKKRHAELTIVVELNDLSMAAGAEYRLWEADTVVKMRVRLNGDAIETVTGPLTYYYYTEMDIYGSLDAPGWGDVEGSNRTIEFTVQSEYDATAGADYVLRAQNTRTTL
jgi:hypothetical protein